ncbi:MAG: right-handed parallel beta-helix repeat-containing protein [Armatimonadota bacterium]
MQVLQVWVMIALIVALTCAMTHGAEYFLAPTGDDANPGTREAPWQSLTRANKALEPGDTATFLPGDYVGSIVPANSGTEQAPITYRSSEPLGARLMPADGSAPIRLDGHEYIAIADFYIDGQHQATWASVTHCRNITISGCEMRRSPGTTLFLESSQLRLIDNTFSADRLRGDMLHIRNCNEVLFEGNSTTRVGHCPLRIHNCFNVAVRANVFRNEWGRNYEFWNSGRLLIERNIVTRARDSAGSADSRAKNLYDDSIFRQNLVFGNLHTPLNTSSYIWRGARATSPLYRGPFVAVNSRFYHNTIADNLGNGWQLHGIHVGANVFKNNIFHRNDYAGGGTQVVRGDEISDDNRFVSNILSGTEPGQPVVQYGSSYWTAGEANENTMTVGDFWSEFHENIDADPAFVDAGNRDYRLTDESPAIDAGTPLTWAMGEGSGRKLPVTDGRWFYDGFGIEGEKGDLIAIGSGENLARIERVELRYYQPAILHLDREMIWEDGAPVSLPWVGEMPDIGAFEHAANHPTQLVALARPAAVEPGQPVSFSLDTFGREVESVTWDFEDGTFSHEMEPTHRWDEAGHYGVTVRATFADDTRGVAPVFVHVPRRLDPQAPLVEVDFEDETRGETWGYYLKFYRGHQTGAVHVDYPDREGKCMRIFYDADKANRTAGQIAPGAWDIDRYPFVRFDYRIPRGVPVTVEVTPFSAPGRPGGFVVAATANQAARIGDLDGYTLADDGQWHTLTMDVRRVREVYPQLQHLRQWMFNTPWNTPPSPVGWMTFPAMEADYKSHPDGPGDVAMLRSHDIVMLRASGAGQWLEMPFTLQQETSGEIFVDLLDHTSRGAVRILLDGEVVVEDYEHWTDGTEMQSVSLGQMTLDAGEHRVRVEVLQRRVGYIGLSGVSIRPEGAAAAPELTLDDFEFWFDNFAILPE